MLKPKPVEGQLPNSLKSTVNEAKIPPVRERERRKVRQGREERKGKEIEKGSNEKKDAPEENRERERLGMKC